MKRKIFGWVGLFLYAALCLAAMIKCVPNSGRVSVAALLVLTGLPWVLTLCEKQK